MLQIINVDAPKHHISQNTPDPDRQEKPSEPPGYFCDSRPDLGFLVEILAKMAFGLLLLPRSRKGEIPMPSVPNTISDFRRWANDRIGELDYIYDHPDPDVYVWARCLEIVQEAGDLATRRGMADLVERSQSFDGGTGPREAKGFMSECLAALALQPRVPDPVPPYFNGEQAADYLDMTRGQLYGQVERRKIVPLRGPGGAYRFTQKMLDEYTHAP